MLRISYRDENCRTVEEFTVGDGRGGQVSLLGVVKVDRIHDIIAVLRNLPHATAHHLTRTKRGHRHAVSLAGQFKWLAVLELVAPRLTKCSIYVVLWGRVWVGGEKSGGYGRVAGMSGELRVCTRKIYE